MLGLGRLLTILTFFGNCFCINNGYKEDFAFHSLYYAYAAYCSPKVEFTFEKLTFQFQTNSIDEIESI